MIAAVLFPKDPNASSFDLQAVAIKAYQSGLQLYGNGRQVALLPHQLPGWTPLEAAKSAA